MPKLKSAFYIFILLFFVSKMVSADENRLDIADPSLIYINGNFLITGTTSAKKKYNMPLIISSTLSNLQDTKIIDAMPEAIPWAKGEVWGVDILTLKKDYLAYFTVMDKSFDIRCIGYARSNNITGPYQPANKPLICNANVKGIIAPSVFKDANKIYLLYKVNAGNGGGNPNTAIWMSELSSDGQHVVGRPIKLLNASETWERGNIESPTLIKSNNLYFLFYSGSYFNSPDYGIGYAVSRTLYGPYEKIKDKAISVASNGQFAAGSQGITKDACGNWVMAYHAYDNSLLKPPRKTYFKILSINGVNINIKNYNNSVCQ